MDPITLGLAAEVWVRMVRKLEFKAIVSYNASNTTPACARFALYRVMAREMDTRTYIYRDRCK